MKRLTMRRQPIVTYAGVAAILFSSACQSGEIIELSVTELDNAYKLRIVAVLDAPADYVYRVITDYRHAYRINPAITSVDILPADRYGLVRVRNRSEHRVGLLSYDVEWVGDIEETEDRGINITTIPEAGSFESGTAHWEIRSQGERTWVLHESRLTPNLYIVPVIGVYIMKKHMKAETMATFNRIECHAQIMLEADMEVDPERLKTVLIQKPKCIQLH